VCSSDLDRPGDYEKQCLENSMITIDEITIVVDGREIIYDYSEQIPAGSITVIVGPNGCGKSTLLAAIAGDIAPDKGTITIDEHHPILTAANTLAGIRSMVILNQSFTLGFTVRQIIEMAGDSAQVMKALELTEIADRLVTTLSGGEAQRVAIAQAIAQNTPVLLLDEPLAAQDIHSRGRIIELLKDLAEQGKTIVVVAHSNETELSWADKVIKQFH
jgi:iron complex transport system ATP-binding protein